MLGNLLIWSFVWRSFFESYSLFYFLPTIHSVRFVYGFLKYANSRHIFASWTSDFLILFLVKIQNSCASFLPPMATDAARFFVNLLEMYPCSFRTTTIPPPPRKQNLWAISSGRNGKHCLRDSWWILKYICSPLFCSLHSVKIYCELFLLLCYLLWLSWILFEWSGIVWYCIAERYIC